MRYLLLSLIIIISSTLQSQTIEDLELKLRDLSLSNNKRELAEQILEQDKYNLTAIHYFLSIYKYQKMNDSIDCLYKKLINENPNDAYPYYIRAYYSEYEGLNRFQIIDTLNIGLRIDSTSKAIHYLLGKTYYELFHQEIVSNNQIRFAGQYASSSIKHFSYNYKLFPELRELVRLPLIQLTSFLHRDQDKRYDYYKKNEFFHLEYLAGLPDNWASNYEIDVFKYIDSGYFKNNWYSEQLSAMSESSLLDSTVDVLLRFTWLRTFDEPIAVGIKNDTQRYTLYWKMCDGKGGYEPGKLILSNSKYISEQVFNNLLNQMDSIGFWDMQTVFDSEGSDGSQWILEANIDGNYHIVDSWCGSNIYPIGKALLKLTDLKYDELKMY